MAKALVGIDFDSYEVRMALVQNNQYLLAAERLPENMVKNGQILMAEQFSRFIKEMKSKHKMSSSACACVLPEQVSYYRWISTPPMSVEQLKMNLPYEFRDFVGNATDKFFYDYAVEELVKDEAGNVVSMELTAAAVHKSVIENYTKLLRKGGFRFDVAMPREAVIYNLSRKRGADEDGNVRDTCMIEFGYDASKVYIFSGKNMQASRMIEIGCRQLEEIIADYLNIDVYLAAEYRETNHDDILSQPCCTELFDRLAVEIMKVINFNAYNNRDSELNDVFFCGIGAQIPQFMNAVVNITQLTQHSLGELFAGSNVDDRELAKFAVAIGVAMRMEG